MEKRINERRYNAIWDAKNVLQWYTPYRDVKEFMGEYPTLEWNSFSEPMVRELIAHAFKLAHKNHANAVALICVITAGSFYNEQFMMPATTDCISNWKRAEKMLKKGVVKYNSFEDFHCEGYNSQDDMVWHVDKKGNDTLSYYSHKEWEEEWDYD